MTDLTPITQGQVPTPPSTEVTTMRRLLGEAGEQWKNIIKEEFSYIIPESDGSHSVYSKRKEVHQVVGVYLATDTSKQNNYFTGLGDYLSPDGGFDAYTGTITLSPNFSYQPMSKVVIDYVHKEGLKDEDIDLIFGWAKVFIKQYTNYQIDVFPVQSDEWWAAIQVAKFACLMLLNTSTVLQAGYNLRIEEFALETKAWGEGMIAQFLLNVFQGEVDAVMANIGWGVRAAKTSRADRSTSTYPHNVEMIL